MTPMPATHDLLPAISQIAGEVFATMLDLPVRPIDPPANDGPYTLTAAVHYVGSWNGTLLLECSKAQAMEWGARLMELPAPIAAEDARDSLGELCNVLAGNLKPILPAGVGLSAPSVVAGTEYSFRVCGDTLCEALYLACPGGHFRLALIIR